MDKSVTFLKEIIDLLKDADFTDIWCLSAYIKENAIYNLTSSIKKSGANIHFLVGVGNGVTSYQALKALLALGVEVYTFDTERIESIFHVKEILACGILAPKWFVEAPILLLEDLQIILKLGL